MTTTESYEFQAETTQLRGEIETLGDAEPDRRQLIWLRIADLALNEAVADWD